MADLMHRMNARLGAGHTFGGAARLPVVTLPPEVAAVTSVPVRPKRTPHAGAPRIAAMTQVELRRRAKITAPTLKNAEKRRAVIQKTAKALKTLMEIDKELRKDSDKGKGEEKDADKEQEKENERKEGRDISNDETVIRRRSRSTVSM